MNGLYEISNLGRVKRLSYTRSIFVNNKTQIMTFKDRILKPIRHNNGYYAVSLSKNNKHKIFLIHKLVAQAFIKNPNNYTDNLEWCNHKHNNNYGNHNKRIAEALGKKVLCIETGIVYKSMVEVERQMGIAHNSISKVCLR